MRIKAFQAWRPAADNAGRVAAVPYDTVDTDEARELAAGNADSFLHVTRPEIDLPGQAHGDALYAQARRALEDFRARGVLVEEDAPHLYIYRITVRDHEQTGVVGVCHVGDYNRNTIRKHEKTRQDKEDDRTRLIHELRAHTGPVFLTHRDNSRLAELVREETRRDELLMAGGEDGSVHRIWRVADPAAYAEAFGRIPECYIADGHHRAAAAARVAAELGAADADAEYNWFLSVLFPAGQLRILPYNRCVADLNGRGPADFIEAVGRQVRVIPNADPAPPTAHAASLYVDGRWMGLAWDVPSEADPVARLDASVLQDRVLAPVLGIGDPRTDSRISFIGGIRGTDCLERLVDSGRAAAAFSMHPVSVDDMMAIADAGQIMPPKSTWFEPKLRSGLLVHLF